MKLYLFLLAQYLIPHRIGGAIIQKLAESRIGWLKNFLIKAIIKRFDIDLADAEIQDIDEFENFNAFFTRRLKSEARNFSPAQSACVSPVDGVLADFGKISESTFIIAKKVKYNIYQLLGGFGELEHEFADGAFASLYLSPRHYHRIHMPELGELKSMRYISGKFYSVNDKAVANINNLYTKNERLVCFFETKHGRLAVVFIGAMFVGSIHTSWQGRINPQRFGADVRNWKFPNPRVSKTDYNPGEEIGHFQMGSSVILVWDHRKKFSEKLEINSEVKVGDDLV